MESIPLTTDEAQLREIEDQKQSNEMLDNTDCSSMSIGSEYSEDQYIGRTSRWKCVKEGGSWVLVKAPKRYCMVGPHWYIMIFTYALMVGFTCWSFAAMKYVPELQKILGVALSVCCFISFVMVSCVNPGHIKRIETRVATSWTYCGLCDSFRPPGAVHCRDCKVCIEGYDHHCPWTGKCIGKRNLCWFYIWVLLITVTLGFDLMLVVTHILPPKIKGRINPLQSHGG